MAMLEACWWWQVHVLAVAASVVARLDKGESIEMQA
jgi:hypothetical protein